MESNLKGVSLFESKSALKQADVGLKSEIML